MGIIYETLLAKYLPTGGISRRSVLYPMTFVIYFPKVTLNSYIFHLYSCFEKR